MKAIAALAFLCSLSIPANQSLLLPGSPADYAEVADNASLSNLPELTAEAWIFPAVSGSQSNGVDCVVAQYSSALGFGPFALSYYRDIERMRPIVNWSLLGFQFFDGDVEVPLGQWTHVAMTYGGGFLRLYVDGVLDKQVAASTAGGIGELQLPYRIGSQAGSSENTFAGLIDEVRLWDVVRTEEQIFDSQAGLAPGDDEGLIGYWRMQDLPTSPVLRDSSAFGNHAQLFGAAETNVADVVPKLASKKAAPRGQFPLGGDPTIP
jgi:hypothetical protein